MVAFVLDVGDSGRSIIHPFLHVGISRWLPPQYVLDAVRLMFGGIYV